MKFSNLLALFLSLAVISIMSSCGGEDAECQTCTQDLSGITTTTEVCADGDDVVLTTLGIDSRIDSTTVADQVTILELAGFTCE